MMMTPRVGIFEIVLILTAAAVLLGVTIAVLRRKRDVRGFPVSPPDAPMRNAGVAPGERVER